MLITATSIALWVIRITGPTQVVLGLLFWTGRALGLLPIHMLVGLVFTVALWTLAALAAAAGLRPTYVLAAAGWGFVVPVFGMLQMRLLPGPGHWIVEVLHLLIGVAAMVVAARLARFVRERPRPARRPHG